MHSPSKKLTECLAPASQPQATEKKSRISTKNGAYHTRCGQGTCWLPYRIHAQFCQRPGGPYRRRRRRPFGMKHLLVNTGGQIAGMLVPLTTILSELGLNYFCTKHCKPLHPTDLHSCLASTILIRHRPSRMVRIGWCSYAEVGTYCRKQREWGKSWIVRLRLANQGTENANAHQCGCFQCILRKEEMSGINVSFNSCLSYYLCARTPVSHHGEP